MWKSVLEQTEEEKEMIAAYALKLWCYVLGLGMAWISLWVLEVFRLQFDLEDEVKSEGTGAAWMDTRLQLVGD